MDTINTSTSTVQPVRPHRANFMARGELIPLLWILALGIVLRLVFILTLDPQHIAVGGDTGWYLQYGLQLVTNTPPGPSSAGPTFLVWLGLLQLIFPAGSVILIARLLNVGWHLLLIAAVYFLGQRYLDRRVAILGALFVAINPIFIIESGSVVTESLYLGLLFGTFALYAARQDQPTSKLVIVVGVMLGLATLTRAVLILFPVVLVVHLIRLQGWRRGLRLGAVLLLAYGLTLSTWTAYNLIKWNRFVIASGGDAMAFIWMGAKNEVRSTQAVDTALGDAATNDTRNQAFQQGVMDSLKNLPDYIRTRLSNLLDSVLQPNNTIYFPGESLKALALNWLTTDRSPAGLLTLTKGDAFWPKLTLYIFHFWTLAFAVVGLWVNRQQFWIGLPLIGYVVYTLAVHSILIALPRYIFPIEPILILLAASGTLAVLKAIRRLPAKRDATQQAIPQA